MAQTAVSYLSEYQTLQSSIISITEEWIYICYHIQGEHRIACLSDFILKETD